MDTQNHARADGYDGAAPADQIVDPLGYVPPPPSRRARDRRLLRWARMIALPVALLVGAVAVWQYVDRSRLRDTLASTEQALARSESGAEDLEGRLQESVVEVQELQRDLKASHAEVRRSEAESKKVGAQVEACRETFNLAYRIGTRTPTDAEGFRIVQLLDQCFDGNVPGFLNPSSSGGTVPL